MNENLNLLELLKDVPSDTEFYCPILGAVYFTGFRNADDVYPIKIVSLDEGHSIVLTADGRYYSFANGECMLFPSKEQRDWAVWKQQQEKHKRRANVTLHPFDRVLGRDSEDGVWHIDFFSHYEAGDEYPFCCIGDCFSMCVPYNRDTAYLFGTKSDCPITYNMYFSRVCDD